VSKIDVHCHVFNKDVLTFSGKILIALGNIVTDLINHGNYNQAETMIERLDAFIELSRKDPAKITQALFDVYGNGAIIVPLMYDMYYLTHDLKKDFKEQLQGFLKRFDYYDNPDRNQGEEIKNKVSRIGNDTLGQIADEAFNHDCFDIQVEGMKALKEQFGDRVYPFMSFDPRRSGNLEAVKQYVGPGKPFHGVKLYPPLGFSAADESMMDQQNGLYAYCVANDIPITAHCSCPGMPTMNDHLYIRHNSWVFISDTGTPDDGDGECSKFNHGKLFRTSMDDTVDFSEGGSPQKSLYFNHPDIWQVVLEAFPSLRLNLAHFGGDCRDWRRRIASMICSNTYQNLYTDISCRTKDTELEGIRQEYDGSEFIQRRLMYGSDFTILLLSSDLPDFVSGVEEVFPSDKHRDIYWNNPRRFLKLPDPS
jgi:predicted TIM-barrel fold metal-dependent hydrolase